VSLQDTPSACRAVVCAFDILTSKKMNNFSGYFLERERMISNMIST
jgi:hypothetical protein